MTYLAKYRNKQISKEAYGIKDVFIGQPVDYVMYIENKDRKVDGYYLGKLHRLNIQNDNTGHHVPGRPLYTPYELKQFNESYPANIANILKHLQYIDLNNLKGATLSLSINRDKIKIAPKRWEKLVDPRILNNDFYTVYGIENNEGVPLYLVSDKSGKLYVEYDSFIFDVSIHVKHITGSSKITKIEQLLKTCLKISGVRLYSYIGRDSFDLIEAIKEINNDIDNVYKDKDIIKIKTLDYHYKGSTTLYSGQIVTIGNKNKSLANICLYVIYNHEIYEQLHHYQLIDINDFTEAALDNKTLVTIDNEFKNMLRNGSLVFK